LVMSLVAVDVKVAGDFRVLPIRNADALAEIEGIVERICVDEGTRVHKGSLVARLVDRDYRAELRKTEAEIAQKSAQLKLLEIGPRPEDIAAQRSRVAKAGEQLKYLQKLRDMNRALFAR